MVWVQNGAYQWFGYFSQDVQDLELIKENIIKAMDNRDVIGIIKSFVTKNNLELIPLKNNEQYGVLF